MVSSAFKFRIIEGELRWDTVPLHTPCCEMKMVRRETIRLATRIKMTH
jgi:hypothetical protein